MFDVWLYQLMRTAADVVPEPSGFALLALSGAAWGSPSDLKNRSCSASSFVLAAFRWVVHASRVLVAASAPQRTFVDWPFRKSVGYRSEVHISRKFVVASRENQHARRECHPIELRLA